MPQARRVVSEARHLGRKVAATNSSSRTSKAGAEPDKVAVVLEAREQARIEIAIGDKARNAGVCKSQSAGSFSVISISPNPSPPVPAEVARQIGRRASQFRFRPSES